MIDKARLSDINDRKRVAREIKVLKKLHHACIVRCFDVIDTPAKIYIVMENASSGSLLDYVRSKKRLREPEAAKFLQQVVHGLIYCHSKGVIHRDIKLENLLLDSDTNIRIIDFGLSAITAPGKRLKVFCGSPSYAAPEIVARRQYDGPPVDVWSLGVVLFAMICGYLPFHAGGDRQALCRKIMKGHYSCPDTISAEAKDLLEQMLTVDPEARITLKQVLAHPWVSHATRWTPPAGELPSGTHALLASGTLSQSVPRAPAEARSGGFELPCRRRAPQSRWSRQRPDLVSRPDPTRVSARVPAANRYTISLDVRGVPMAHPEILRRMEALGTSREDVLDALTQREVNRVTAMYFLLQDQWLEQQAGATSHAHATALVRAATAQGGARPLSAAGTGGGAAARAQTAPDGAREEEGRCGERVKAPDVRGVWGPGQTAPSGSAKDTVLYGHAAMSHRPHLVAPTR